MTQHHRIFHPQFHAHRKPAPAPAPLPPTSLPPAPDSHPVMLALAAYVTSVEAYVAAVQGQQPTPTPVPVPTPTPTPTPPPGGTIQWPSFTGTATFVGTSPVAKVSVYYDATLGAAGLKNATDLLAAADRVAAAQVVIFGVPTQPVNVIVFALGGATDGTGGADHMGCDYGSGGNIEVCASFGNSMRVSALFEAELSEDAMNGNLCGCSTGEALSRWCAMVVSGNALSDFVSAPTWQQDGMANWVDTTEATDQDYDSIGCGMAFISWLIAKNGMTLGQVAQAMVKNGDNGTLSQLYQTPSTAWTDFMAAVNSIGTIMTDDPFGGLALAVRA